MKSVLNVGIDVGSTTIKLVVLDHEKKILYKNYARHFSEIGNALQENLTHLKSIVGEKKFSFALTGSAGMGIAQRIGLPFVQEVIACAAAVKELIPQTDTVVELGGEDAKITYFGDAPEQRMNGVCAGGTGSFIDHMASLLSTDAKGLDDLAAKGKQIYTIASRCGVFAKTDIQALMNDGAEKADIALSIFQAVVNQTIGNLAQGRPISGHVAFLGGPLHFLPELRKRFKGKPEYVMNFMRFAAQELREYMAKLGVRTVDELVGRTDLIKAGKMAEEYNVDLSRIIDNPFANDAQSKISYANKNPYNFELEKTVDETVLMKKLGPALEKKQKKTIEIDVSNINRSLGTIFGSEITKKYGTTLDEDTFVVKCHGSGGQSFGAFIPKGLTLELVGDSNDYIGKGLSGGKIIVYPQDGIRYDASENIIVGNVALYGATSGKAFINGVAGERFAVRNSGATAVVEGVGEHGCEYMTGGRVVILGPTGKNFAAGMSGGIAYVLDMDSDLYMKLNKQMVEVESVVDKYDVMELKDMIVEHVQCTNSKRGKEVLEHFEEYLPKFKKIIPHDYKKMMSTIGQMEVKGLSSEQALIEAFYAIKNH